MKFLKVIVLTYSVLACSLVSADQTVISADDGFSLHASYFEPEKKSQLGVLMLHQCNYNRSMYEQVGQQLAANGIHALSLDFRGFGDSVNDEYDMAKVESLSETERNSLLGKLYGSWPSDAAKTLEFLKTKVGTDGKIGVVGASCGGSLAVRLSESFDFSAVVLFSSAQGEKNLQRYERHLSQVPTLLVASLNDTESYESAASIFKRAKSPASKFLSYTGDAHGYPLYEQDELLQSDIVNWVTNNL